MTGKIEEFELAGIAALVRAGEEKSWFFGHFGAMMISGSRLLRLPNFPEEAGVALSGLLQGLCVDHSKWYAPLESSHTSRGQIDPLIDALSRGAAQLRTSGHSTIYMTTALTVLEREPALASDRVVEGLLALHEAGRQDDRARYFGVPDYFEAADSDFGGVAEENGDSLEAFRIAISSLEHLVADRTVDGRHYFLTGEKIHLLTHAHAITTLRELGHAAIAERGMIAQRHLAQLVKPSCSLRRTKFEAARLTPLHKAFWEQAFIDPAHVIKVAEAVVTQTPRLEASEREVAQERMRGVWALLGLR